MTAIVTKNTFIDFDGHGNVFMKALTSKIRSTNHMIFFETVNYDDDCCYKEHFL